MDIKWVPSFSSIVLWISIVLCVQSRHVRRRDHSESISNERNRFGSFDSDLRSSLFDSRGNFKYESNGHDSSNKLKITYGRSPGKQFDPFHYSITVESGEIISGSQFSQEMVSGEYRTYEYVESEEDTIRRLLSNPIAAENVADGLAKAVKRGVRISHVAVGNNEPDLADGVNNIAVGIAQGIPGLAPPTVVERPVVGTIRRGVRIYHVPEASGSPPTNMEGPDGRQIPIVYAGPGTTPGKVTDSNGIVQYFVLPQNY